MIFLLLRSLRFDPLFDAQTGRFDSSSQAHRSDYPGGVPWFPNGMGHAHASCTATTCC